MLDEKISIIVPIYNVEKYIKKCIDSIIVQTYTNIEIILVDDGSPDNCGKICDEYKEKDSRIRVIHKENTGVSGSRNIGLQNITGTYVTFIDADDYIEKDMIEILYKALKEYNADISICGTNDLKSNYELKRQSKCKQIVEMDKKNALKELLNEQVFTCVCWAKLYNAKLFETLKFNEQTKIAEDLEILYKILDKCNKVVYVPENKYNYLLRENSATKEKFNKDWIREIEISKEILNFIEKNYSDIYEYAAKRYVRINITCVYKILKTSGNINDVKKLTNNIKPYYKYYLKSSYISKKYKIAVISLLINPGILINIYKLKNKIKKRK